MFVVALREVAALDDAHSDLVEEARAHHSGQRISVRSRCKRNLTGAFARCARSHTGVTNGRDSSTNLQLASLTGGTSVCSDVVSLVADVINYDQGPQAKYLPWPRGSYRNSNSFTYTLLESIGQVGPGALATSNWGPIGWAPGWGLSVPGLN